MSNEDTEKVTCVSITVGPNSWFDAKVIVTGDGGAIVQLYDKDDGNGVKFSCPPGMPLILSNGPANSMYMVVGGAGGIPRMEVPIRQYQVLIPVQDEE